MDQTTRYPCDPIQPGQIRLCRFVQDGDYLSAILETTSINNPRPQYRALSYTWALDQNGAKKNWVIRIGDQYLPVLDSLQPFVQALRAKGTLLDGTRWWIDSICIDQANTHERDEHVRCMRKTYQQAHEVIVWLGEQSDDSDCALDFIHFLDAMDRANYSTEDMRRILKKDEYRAKWTALQNFFLRRWWTRVWTIQEFVIPSNISFWCGSQHISKDTLSSALIAANRCNTTGFKNPVAFHHAWTRRRAWVLYKAVLKPGESLNLSLLALAAYFCSMDATDDRDRLYGLAGLATEHHALEINYSWSVDEVYLRFAQSFVAKHKSLDILGFASLFTATPGSSLPSWVPDWRTRVQPLVIPLLVSQSSNSFVGNLRPPWALRYGETVARYSASGTRPAQYSFDGLTLVARGCVIDAIDGLAGSQASEMVQSSEQHLQRSDKAPSPMDILTSICRSLVLDRKERYMQYPMPTEQFCHDFVHLCLPLISESQHAVPQEFQHWFQSTRLLRIHGTSFEKILRDIRHNCTDASTPNQDEWIQDSFYGRFFDIVERLALRLMTSRNGRIGMAPRNAEKGDVICILFGCSVPIVLRRSGHKDQYTVVGECYLDGHMEGEALEQSELLEETFRII